MADKQKPRREARKPKAVKKAAMKPEPCSHPVNRRIGDGCPVCGTTGLK